MKQNGQSNQQTEIILPIDVECALFRVLRHYWNIEQSEHADGRSTNASATALRAFVSSTTGSSNRPGLFAERSNRRRMCLPSDMSDGSRRGYRPLVQVSEPSRIDVDSVTTFLDGRQIVNWKTDFSDLTNRDLFKVKRDDTLGLASFSGVLTVESAEVVEISGAGHWVK